MYYIENILNTVCFVASHVIDLRQLVSPSSWARARSLYNPQAKARGFSELISSRLYTDMGNPTDSPANNNVLSVVDKRTGKSYTIPCVIDTRIGILPNWNVSMVVSQTTAYLQRPLKLSKHPQLKERGRRTRLTKDFALLTRASWIPLSYRVKSRISMERLEVRLFEMHPKLYETLTRTFYNSSTL